MFWQILQCVRGLQTIQHFFVVVVVFSKQSRCRDRESVIRRSGRSADVFFHSVATLTAVDCGGGEGGENAASDV